MQNGVTLEHAQTIANHESPRITKLYDGTREELTVDEIGRIRILIFPAPSGAAAICEEYEPPYGHAASGGGRCRVRV
jgi:hypothetical protein